MTFVIPFAVSGLVIVLLLATKALEQNRRKHYFLTRLISRGDTYVREVYHRVVNSYFEFKEWFMVFFKKQLPLRSRNVLNKFTFYLKEKREVYLQGMRDSRLIKKREGISEFLKNVSNTERGNGEINETYEDHSQNEEKRLE